MKGMVAQVLKEQEEAAFKNKVVRALEYKRDNDRHIKENSRYEKRDKELTAIIAALDEGDSGPFDEWYKKLR